MGHPIISLETITAEQKKPPLREEGKGKKKKRYE